METITIMIFVLVGSSFALLLLGFGAVEEKLSLLKTSFDAMRQIKTSRRKTAAMPKCEMTKPIISTEKSLDQLVNIPKYFVKEIPVETALIMGALQIKYNSFQRNGGEIYWIREDCTERVMRELQLI